MENRYFGNPILSFFREFYFRPSLVIITVEFADFKIIGCSDPGE